MYLELSRFSGFHHLPTLQPRGLGAAGWVSSKGGGPLGSWRLTTSVGRAPTLVPGNSADGSKAAVFWGSLRVKVAFHCLSWGAGHILL